MIKHHVKTHVHLSPRHFSDEVAHEILESIFARFHWFEPRRYGSASLARYINPSRPNIKELVAWYQEHGSLCVAARTDKDYLWLSRASTGSSPLFSKLTWAASSSTALDSAWRQNHQQQVAELMRKVHSPLAQSALEEDFGAKMLRLIPDGVGLLEAFTVRHYSEGLAGVFWRNFYGAPFVRLFGDRLAAVPPECVQALGEDLVLVQPYETPQEAGTGEARAREAQLISLLGPECFYDHERHQPPSRRPVLEYLERPVP